MKINPDFELRDICDEKVLISRQDPALNPDRLIVFNPSAAYLWNAVKGQSFTTDDLCSLLCQTYEIAPDQAKADAQAIAERWRQLGLVSDEA